jgi:hypothetical protein
MIRVKDCKDISGITKQIARFLEQKRGTRYIKEVAVAKVPRGYLPASLVGERGVITSSAIERGTVIGEFEGACDAIYTNRSAAAVKDDDDWGFVSDDYSAGGVTSDGVVFRINPTIGGNGYMEMINDPRGSGQPANLEWLTVTVDLAPHLFLVATRHIKKDEWLTVEYGADFWASRALLDQ